MHNKKPTAKNVKFYLDNFTQLFKILRCKYQYWPVFPLRYKNSEIWETVGQIFQCYQTSIAQMLKNLMQNIKWNSPKQQFIASKVHFYNKIFAQMVQITEDISSKILTGTSIWTISQLSKSWREHWFWPTIF